MKMKKFSTKMFSRPAWLFLLMLLCDGLFFAGWQLFFNFYILAKGFDKEFLGLITSVQSLSALALAVPMGLASDRLGRKRAMLIGLLGATLVLFVMAVTSQGWVILAMSFLCGPLANLYVLSHAPFMMRVSNASNRDLLFSMSYGMFPLANALGNLIYGPLPGWFGKALHVADKSAAAYQAVLLTSLGLSLLMILPLLLIREPAASVEPDVMTDKPAPKPNRSAWRIILQPTTIKLALPNLMIGMGAALLIPYMNLFFSERHHISDASLGALFSLASLITGLGCIAGPRLVGNLGGKVRTVLLGQIVSLVFLLAIGFSPWLGLAVVGFLVRGTLMNMVTPLFDAFAMEQTPEHAQGVVNSVRNLTWNVGWIIGPLISGWVQERYGFTPLFVSTAVMYAFAITFTWLCFGRRRAPLVVAAEAVPLLAEEAPAV